mmetsp:Transcript_14105/g.47779  ORF Transcript_14105/g.47779 Transcript_14105/m.47779 type:complete len:326 (+) Transcript_14105:483-1460(+)
MCARRQPPSPWKPATALGQSSMSLSRRPEDTSRWPPPPSAASTRRAPCSAPRSFAPPMQRSATWSRPAAAASVAGQSPRLLGTSCAPLSRSMPTAAQAPLRAAKCSAVSPVGVLALTSAECWTRSAMEGVHPRTAARCTARLPVRLFSRARRSLTTRPSWSTKAARSRIASTTHGMPARMARWRASWPSSVWCRRPSTGCTLASARAAASLLLAMAAMSGVESPCETTCTRAPLPISCLMAPTRPWAAAAPMGVTPWQSRASKPSQHRATAAVSPQAAARCSAVSLQAASTRAWCRSGSAPVPAAVTTWPTSSGFMSLVGTLNTR